MRVTADTDICLASGQCVLLAPQIFDQRADDGIVVTLSQEPPPEQQDAVRHAVLNCPSGALRLTAS